MRIKSLIAASILALSSTAMAHPLYRSHGNYWLASSPDNYRLASSPNNYRLASSPNNSHEQYSSRPYGYQVMPSSYGYQVASYAYGQNPYQANIARDQWSTFADGVALGYGGAVRMPMRGQRLAALELQATRGGSFVDSILVELVDGRQLEVAPQRALDVIHAPNLRVDLGDTARCGIRSVTISGQNVSGGQFRVIGA